MAQTTKYHISYLDEDNQSVYDLTSDIPKYDKQQALSIEAALESIDLTEAVGDLNNLETIVKSSIVAAINELKGDEANVGSLGDLETTIKTSIVASINELKGNITNLQSTDATFATAINMKISNTEKGSNNGVAQLDSNGKVPLSQLPSYVDDVIVGYYYNDKFYEDSEHTTEITGEVGKIYIDLTGNKIYRFEENESNGIYSDLTDYIKSIDYATDNIAGVIMTNSARGFSLGSSHQALASVFTNEQYASKDNYTFIGKGTLENVLNARIGDIETLLYNINRGSGVE